MKRINIVWDEEGLVAGIITGVATISEGKSAANISPARPFRIEVSKDVLNVRGMGGYLPPAYDEHRDLIHTMAECYYAGLIGKKDLHHWITKKG